MISIQDPVPASAKLEPEEFGLGAGGGAEVSAASTRPNAPLTDQEIEDLAREILEVGRRLGFDDYDARLEAFSETMAGLDPASASRLIGEIYEQDRSASAFWLDAHSLADLLANGRVTPGGHAAIANAFAKAYVDGAISEDQAVGFFSVYIGDTPASGRSGWFEPVANFAAAGGPLMSSFIDAFAEDLLERLNSPSAVSFAFYLASESPDPSASARLFESLPAERQEEVLGHLARYGRAYTVREAADPFASLISSITAHGTPESAIAVAAHAVAAARQNPDAFFDAYDHTPLPERGNALSQLLASPRNGREVLEAFAANDINLTIGSNETNAERAARDLAMLLRLTALSGNSDASAAMGAVETYVQDLQDRFNRNEVTDADYYALSIVGVAARVAVAELFEEAEARQATRKALIDFILDVGLSALPFGSMADDLMQESIAQMFGDGSGPVRRALERVAGEIVDTTTGRITDEAREAIYDVASDETSSIVTMQDLVNGLVQAILIGVQDIDHRLTLSNRIELLSGQLRD